VPFNVTDLPDGLYTSLIEATDTHTTALFTEKPVIEPITTKDFNIYTYKMEHGDIVFKTTLSTEIKPVYETDRIKQEFTVIDTKQPVTYTVTADKIVYLPKSEYMCHLIINDKYWYDCEGLNKASIKQVKDNSYEIMYYPETIKSYSDSLGGLNEFSTSVQFFIDTLTQIPKNKETTILITDVLNVPLENVLLSANIVSGNGSINYTVNFTSDSLGMLLFPYNSNYTYHWVFTHPDYDTFEYENITLKYSQYHITLTQEAMTLENIYISMAILAFAIFMAFIALFMTSNRVIRVLAGVTMLITGAVFYPISFGLMMVLILFGLFIGTLGLTSSS
jgi:hypothetical protein